jgi:hypothetical protein
MILGPWLFQRDILNNPRLKLHPETSLDQVWQVAVAESSDVTAGRLVTGE